MEIKNRTYFAVVVVSFDDDPHCHQCTLYNDWGCGAQQESKDDMLFFPECLQTCPLREFNNGNKEV